MISAEAATRSPTKGWRRVALGDITREVTDRVGLRSLPVYSCSKLYGVIPQSARFKVRIASQAIAHYKVLDPGQFVFDPMLLWDGSIGLNKTGQAGAVSPAYTVFSRTPDVDPIFLEFLLRQRAMCSVYKSVSVGTNVRRQKVKYRDFAGLSVLVPDLAEQRAIARALSTVRRAEETNATALTGVANLRASLFHHLFSYGSIPAHRVGDIAIRETSAGLLPAHWQVIRVGDAGQVITGSTPPSRELSNYGGVIPFIGPGDLDGRPVVSESEKTLSYQGARRARLLPRNSVMVVCIGATIGKVARTGAEQSATNQQINSVIANPQIVVPEFLHHCLEWAAPRLRVLNGSAAIPIVNKSNFADLLIPLPPMDEQRKIAETIFATDRLLLSCGAAGVAIKYVFEAALQGLLTTRTRIPVR